LSGFVAATIAADVLALGAARFIEKGADPDVIVAAIEDVAAQRLTLPALPVDCTGATPYARIAGQHRCA